MLMKEVPVISGLYLLNSRILAMKPNSLLSCTFLIEINCSLQFSDLLNLPLDNRMNCASATIIKDNGFTTLFLPIKFRGDEGFDALEQVEFSSSHIALKGTEIIETLFCEQFQFLFDYVPLSLLLAEPILTPSEGSRPLSGLSCPVESVKNFGVIHLFLELYCG